MLRPRPISFLLQIVLLWMAVLAGASTNAHEERAISTGEKDWFNALFGGMVLGKVLTL